MEEEYLQEISDLETNVAELEERIEELESELQESEFLASTLQEDNWELEREVDDLESNVGDLEEELAEFLGKEPSGLLGEFVMDKGDLYNKALTDAPYMEFKSEEHAFLIGIEYALAYLEGL